jgi:hypothetical protein
MPDINLDQIAALSSIAKSIIGIFCTIFFGVLSLLIGSVWRNSRRLVKIENAEHKTIWKRIDEQSRDLATVRDRISMQEGKLEIFYDEHTRLACGKSSHEK